METKEEFFTQLTSGTRFLIDAAQKFQELENTGEVRLTLEEIKKIEIELQSIENAVKSLEKIKTIFKTIAKEKK